MCVLPILDSQTSHMRIKAVTTSSYLAELNGVANSIIRQSDQPLITTYRLAIAFAPYHLYNSFAENLRKYLPQSTSAINEENIISLLSRKLKFNKVDVGRNKNERYLSQQSTDANVIPFHVDYFCKCFFVAFKNSRPACRDTYSKQNEK